MQHQDAVMRTTVDIPDHLHRILLGLARHTGKSLSQAMTELMQRGLEMQPDAGPTKAFTLHPDTGLPYARSSRMITAEDVRAIDNDG